MGIERKEADCSPKSRACNFTNEGGYEYRFRYLKNIMGLWMIQNAKKELQNQYGFPELASLAKEASSFPSLVDVNDASFLAPDSMLEAVDAYCARTGQQVPGTLSERLACIYNSLAKSYGDTVREIEEITGRTFSRLHIVGGGCQDQYLNSLTKNATGKDVYAGPIEGTALGNLMAQMLKTG
jgi:rhamnulokinase